MWIILKRPKIHDIDLRKAVTLVIYIMQMLASNPFMEIDFAGQEKYDEDSDDNSEHF